MYFMQPSWRVAKWAVVTALTATTSRWLGRAMADRPLVRRHGSPAACEPDAARVQQRLADTLPWRVVEAQLARQTVRPFRVTPPLRRLKVLNLDHGPGGIAAALANALPRDATIVAIDSLPGMAELARHRAQRRVGAGEVQFARAWFWSLPFADSTFDLVVTAGALHQWPEPEAALAEIRRVLAPAGRFVIADLRRDVTGPLWILARFLQAVVVPRALASIGEPTASLGAAYTQQELEWLLARAKLPAFAIKQGPIWLLAERAMAPEAHITP